MTGLDMYSTKSYLEPQDPAFAAGRRAYLQRDYAAHCRRRSTAPCAPYVRVRTVRGGLPTLGRHR